MGNRGVAGRLLAVAVLFTVAVGGWGLSAVAQPTAATPEAPAPAAEPAKLALLVGINEYQHNITDLDGAVNDVAAMKSLLVDHFGFPDDPDHIRVLTDGQATREAILGAFREHLLGNPRLNDDSIVVFHYSGHGSQMPDVSDDEADPWDETLVPHDSGRPPHANRDITDDEINGLLAALAATTPNVTFIFDSCHSGTATRGAGKARTAPPDERRPPTAESAATAAATEEGRSDLRPAVAAYTLISGAAAKEQAREVSKAGRSYGALTWHLVEEMRKAAVRTAEVTYEDIMDKVRLQVTADFPQQHPQLEVAGDVHYVFSARSQKAEPYVLVNQAAGGKVRLGAGQVHGVTAGSIYEVYAPGTKSFDAEARSVARIEVESVDVTTSLARHVEGQVRKDASRAVEREHHFQDSRITVHLMGLEESSTLQAVARELAQYSHIEAVEDLVGYDLLIREEEGYILTEAGDPSPISPRVPVDSGAVPRVVEQITDWAKWLGVLAIEHQDPRLDVAFRVERTGTRGGTAFLEREVDLTMSVGDPFEISVTNNSGSDLYIAVLDLESDGSVSVVYPATGNEEYVAAGDTWKRPAVATLPAGVDVVRDVLKLFATTTPCRFDFLEQKPVRGSRSLAKAGERERNALEELMANAAMGVSRGDEAPPVKSWTTAELVLEVRRGESGE